MYFKEIIMNIISLIILLFTLLGCNNADKVVNKTKKMNKTPSVSSFQQKTKTPQNPDSPEKQQILEKIKQVNDNLQALQTAIVHTAQSTENINLDPILDSDYSRLYKKRVENAVRENLKLKYNRHELAFLKDEHLTQPEEKPYEFKSLNGKFLDKAQALYNKLYQSNPYHRQGILARSCGLSMLTIADKEYKKAHVKAQIAHDMANIMEGIVLGVVLPPLGVKKLDIKKPIYELCTGKNLLTGQKVIDTTLLMSQTMSYFVNQNLTIIESDYKRLWKDIRSKEKQIEEDQSI